MCKASGSIEEKPFCFPMSSVQFQGHTSQKIANLASSPEDNSSCNSQIASLSLKGCRRGTLLFLKVICPVSQLFLPLAWAAKQRILAFKQNNQLPVVEQYFTDITAI